MAHQSDTLIRPQALTQAQVKNIIARLLKYAARQRAAWVAAIIAILLSALASSLTLQIIEPLLDVAVPKAKILATQTAGLQQITIILAYMFGLTVVGTWLMRWGRITTGRLAQNIVSNFRADFYRTLALHNPNFFRKHEASELVSIGMSDFEVVSVFLTQQVPFLLVNAGMLALAIVFMFTLSWQLAAASVILVGGLQWLSMRVFIPQIQSLAAKNRRFFADVSLRLSENISAMRDIQLFGQEERTAQEFERSLKGMSNEVIRHTELTVNNVAVFYLLQGLGLTLIYGAGAYGTVFYNYDLGLLVSFAGFFAQFAAPITAFGNALGSFQSSLVSLHRAFRLMDSPPEISEKPEALNMARFKGHIKFEDVGFSYEQGTHAWRLKHINFEILPGEKVAIVGGSGTGKSTLFNLLARFYDVNEGRITIDGYDVRELTLSSLRNNLGWVAQNVMLFQDTITNNIRFAKPQASIDEVMKAAMIGQVTEFAEQLPQGFDTMIGERGEGLSGGQKQRLSIARAALSDPSILLLDEATSALDNRSQALVMRSIDILTRERTSLHIAHRLSAIVNVDKIIVLGLTDERYVTIKGVGTHAELLDTCEEYYRLHNLKLDKKAILMPMGPMYNTIPVLPTVIGLAAAYNAPVYVLDFGEISHADLHTGRFGIQTEYTAGDTHDTDTINQQHHERVTEVLRILQGDGITADVVTARPGDSWINSTINAIDTLQATHVVAMDNVLIPLDELRQSIQTIERKTSVDYILVNPLAGVVD